MKLPAGLDIRYAGHATFVITTPSGKVIVMDPWFEGNPACPADLLNIDRVDICLITHGHFDHINSALWLWNRTKCTFVTNFEIGVWLANQGVENEQRLNKGGSVTVDGITITAVPAQHSSGILDENGNIIYGGEPLGFVVTLEGGFAFYNAGDTGPFLDQQIISELYEPVLAFLPIGGHFTAGPREAAFMCRFLTTVEAVIPQHYGTFPLIAGTPEQLCEHLEKYAPGVEVIALKPGESAKG